MTQRHWLVQMHRYWVWQLAEFRELRADFGPPVDRPGQEPPNEGDPVVLWQMGAGDKAGAVAYGYFTGPLEMAAHAVNYSEDPMFEKAGTQRLTRRIEFTHWFHATDKVTRTELKTDPAFTDFTLFKPMGAKVMNPFPVTAEQHQAILGRVPAWADLSSAPQVEYVIELALPTKHSDLARAATDLRSQVAVADGEPLRIDVIRADDQPRGDVDQYAKDFKRMPAQDVVLVTYATISYGRTAYEAGVDALADLVADPATIDAQGCELISVRYFFGDPPCPEQATR